MRLDDRFGDYLLFRKLGTSPLGSTYRAGRLQARAIDRVVLLQCFDGDDIDRPRLAADAKSRAPVLGKLTAPQFANGLGLGTEDGVPYVAYDYLLGRTLKETLDRAGDRGTPPTTSYLVALIEQAAGSLAAASQVSVDAIPVRHGFLVPELLLLSAEGRVYPLGFSHGPALLRQKALIERFAPYLAPETRLADHAIGDDVYSLAAILFEGLTGSPPDPDKGTATQVDQALLTVAGAPIPPAVQDLLKSGLAPQGSRADLKGFYRSLRRIVQETEDSPSQFQLAFFLHRLFRDELEAEAVEMRGEKTTRFDPLVLTPAQRDPAPAPETPEEEPDEADAFEPPALDTSAAPPPPAKISRLLRRPFLSGVALALALAALTTAALQLTRRAPAVAADEVVSEFGQQADPAVDAELRRLVAAGASDLQDKLEAEYEPRLRRLREDVVAAQAVRRQRELAARRAAQAAQAPPRPVAEPRPPSPEPASPEPASPEPANPEPVSPEPVSPEPAAADPSPAAPNEESQPLPAPVSPTEAIEPALIAGPAISAPPESTSAPSAAEIEPESSAAPPAEDRAAVEVTLPPPRLEPAPRSVAAPASGPAARRSAPPDAAADEKGASEQSSGFSPPRLLEPPQPRYPPAAQRLGKTARVQVRVLVDAEGRVSETELLSDEIGFGFDKAALQAASRTRWEPARRDGEATSAWAVLTIDFRM